MSLINKAEQKTAKRTHTMQSHLHKIQKRQRYPCIKSQGYESGEEQGY